MITAFDHASQPVIQRVSFAVVHSSVLFVHDAVQQAVQKKEADLGSCPVQTAQGPDCAAAEMTVHWRRLLQLPAQQQHIGLIPASGNDRDMLKTSFSLSALAG